jgi:Glycosyl hydrolase family 46
MSEFVPFDPTLINYIRRILSVAETDKPVWDPSAVYKYNDGPNRTPQWTLSVGFTEMGGNLRVVLDRYIELGGTLAVQFAPYLAVMGKKHIADPEFKTLLQEAGKEPAMAQAQTEIFDQKYLGPAFAWAKKYGFTKPLSFLVIADSFLHSGSMLDFLLNRFPEKKPAVGGDEDAWIKAYLRERREWLGTHSNSILRGTVYRADCYLREIKKDNWSLAASPVSMHGTDVLPA